jgi:hypothetical protein
MGLQMKPWYKSKTILFNTFMAALVALEAVSGLLQPLLPVNVYTAIAVSLPVVNAILRVITSQGIKV